MPYRTTKRGEVQQLQYELAREIGRDAPEIAKGVFGDNSMHPDMATISNDELDALYRQRYLSNDRTWLQAEARRDPEQFLNVVKRIGVQLPSPGLDGQPRPMPRPDTLARKLAPAAAPVVPPPLPVAPPVVAPVLPAPPVAAPPIVQPPLPGML